MKNSKVTIKSLSECSTPFDSEKCGTLIQNLYAAIACPANDFRNLDFSIIKHNHHKAIIMINYEFPSDYLKFKEYFYRYYADKFTWRENVFNFRTT